MTLWDWRLPDTHFLTCIPNVAGIYSPTRYVYGIFLRVLNTLRNRKLSSLSLVFKVYRLVKAGDASTTYAQRDDKEQSGLPLNHKFSSNDVIVLTLQPRGSGDFFGPRSLPTNSFAVSVEARVLNTGPAYVDIALPGGAFEATFGPAPNDVGGKGDRRMRLRADLFFSNIPYTRMVDALSQITSIPDRKKKQPEGPTQTDLNTHDNICMDEVLRDAILSTYTLNDASSPLFRDPDACDLREMVSRVDYGRRPP
jgi:hypothetical protein